MHQLNVLPVEVSQPTDFKSESSLSSSENQTGDDRFSAMVDRHLDSGKSGKSSKKADSNGNKLSNADNNQSASNEKTAADNKKDIKETSSDNTTAQNDSAAPAGKNESNKAASGDDKHNTETEDLSTTEESVDQGADLNQKQLTKAELSQLEQSQHFLTLVNSANNILQKNTDGQTVEQNEPKVSVEANAQLNDLIAKLTGKADDLVDDENLKQNQSSATKNEELALKISQTIKGEQLKEGNKLSSLAEAITKVSTEESTDLPDSDDNIDVDILSEQSKVVSAKNSEGKAALSSQQLEQIKPALDKSMLSEQSINDEPELNSDEVVDLISALDTTSAKLTNNNAQTEILLKENKKSISASNIQGGDKKLTAAQALSAKELLDEQEKSSALNESDIQAVSQSGNVQAATLQTSNSSSNNSSKSLQAKTESQQVSINSVIDSKPASAEQNSGDEQNNHSLANEQEFIQNAAMLNVADEVDANTVKKPSAFSSNVTPLQSAVSLTDTASQTARANELESSQNIIEAMDNSIVNDNINQIKNNGATLNETISIFRKDFAEAVKEKVMVMISQKLQQFDIRLDPPELGNVHVRVNLQNEQAVVNFTVQNQQAKEAFEENLGKLKDMLSEHGVDVGDANVEQQAQQSDEEGAGESDSGNHNSENNELESVDTVLSANLFKSSSSSVDYYA